jgi:hypothetical protein
LLKNRLNLITEIYIALSLRRRRHHRSLNAFPIILKKPLSFFIAGTIH